MGDLYIHDRMKECCRAVLGEMDKHKRGVKFDGGLLAVPSLMERLGDKTIPDARKLLPAGGGKSESAAGSIQATTQDICAKLAKNHGDEHTSHSETTEAAFWYEVAQAVYASGGVEKTPKDNLKDAANKALKDHPNACNQSTAAAAKAMGHDELGGMNANQQVDYMEANWKSVDAATAHKMANEGGLVVAGLQEKGHGHTALVVPGDGATKPDGNFYPNVQGGSLGGVGSAGYSNGSKTAGDVWSRSDRGKVKYYTPAG